MMFLYRAGISGIFQSNLEGFCGMFSFRGSEDAELWILSCVLSDSYSDCVLSFSGRSIGEKESCMGDWSADPSSKMESGLLCCKVEEVVDARFWILCGDDLRFNLRDSGLLS